MKKIILIIIDGLGDTPVPQLDNKTPLEAAKTPNLDFLVQNGTCGLVEPFKFSSQEKPESDTCHLAIFGYDPNIYYLGRGPYEAAGIGINLKEGDLALRANFATVDKNLIVIDRRAGRIEETQSLIRALNEIKIKGIKFFLKKSFGHRAVLVIRGKNLSDKISDSDPHKIGFELKNIVPLDKTREANFTAGVLNEFLNQAHQILASHPLNKERDAKGLLPANCILTRGAGFFKKTPSFKEMYGLKAACIAGGALYKGIAKILGMDLVKVRGANGFINTNLKGKFLAARKILRQGKERFFQNVNKENLKPKNYKKYDFVFLHIKAADSLAEDGNFQGKKEFIEKIDENIKFLLAGSNKKSKTKIPQTENLSDTLIVVTGDHTTSCQLKSHSSEPVPILIWGSGIKQKEVINKFSERECQNGDLGKIEALSLMKKILGLANKK